MKERLFSMVFQQLLFIIKKLIFQLMKILQRPIFRMFKRAALTNYNNNNNNSINLVSQLIVKALKIIDSFSPHEDSQLILNEMDSS